MSNQFFFKPLHLWHFIDFKSGNINILKKSLEMAKKCRNKVVPELMFSYHKSRKFANYLRIVLDFYNMKKDCKYFLIIWEIQKTLIFNESYKEVAEWKTQNKFLNLLCYTCSRSLIIWIFFIYIFLSLFLCLQISLIEIYFHLKSKTYMNITFKCDIDEDENRLF